MLYTHKHIYLPHIYVHLPRQGKQEQKLETIREGKNNLNVLGIPKLTERKQIKKRENRKQNWKLNYCIWIWMFVQ